MASCEPGRTSAYSEDLRWRMVWQREALEYTYNAITRNLGVDSSTVARTLELFNTSGSVSKRPYPKGRAFQKLTVPVQLLILHLAVQRPGIYLHEIQELSEFLLLDISLSSICRFLHHSGFTRQRLRTVALQRDAFLREQYISDISVYSPEMFIFLDETGADRRNTLRKYSYSLRGKTPQDHALLVRGQRISAIACMSVEGILDVKTVKGTSNGDTFYDFVQAYLLPHLMPYGVNPHSVVILDNCAIHHVAEVMTMLEEVGVLVHFLPPYSPDLNPIEEAFSKVKSTLKTEMEGISDMEALILSSFTSTSTDDCKGWIFHTGISGP